MASLYDQVIRRGAGAPPGGPSVPSGAPRPSGNLYDQIRAGSRIVAPTQPVSIAPQATGPLHERLLNWLIGQANYVMSPPPPERGAPTGAQPPDPLAGTEYARWGPTGPTTATQRVLGRAFTGIVHGAIPIQGVREKLYGPDSAGPSLEGRSPVERVLGWAAQQAGEGAGFSTIPLPIIASTAKAVAPGAALALKGVGQVLEAVPGVKALGSATREAMASTDFSALRQAAVLVARYPVEGLKAFVKQFPMAFSRRAFEEGGAEIAARPTYALMRRAGVSLPAVTGGAEELFPGSFIEKIPVIGSIVKGSNQAYIGMISQLRAGSFDTLYNAAKSSGVEVTDTVLKNMGRFINTASGRGDLGAFEDAAGSLATSLFAPRFLKSRLDLLNPAYYASLDPFVRKEALRATRNFIGLGAAVLEAASFVPGVSVGTDARSADFGQIKVGNTRLDVWAGLRPLAVLAARLGTGEVVSSTTQQVSTPSRLGMVARTGETKLAPIPSLALDVYDAIKGQKKFGQPVNVTEEISSRFAPMVVQDFIKLISSEGWGSAWKGVPGIFGAGINTYGGKPGWQPPDVIGPAILPTIRQALGVQPRGTLSTEYTPGQRTQQETRRAGRQPQDLNPTRRDGQIVEPSTPAFRSWRQENPSLHVSVYYEQNRNRRLFYSLRSGFEKQIDRLNADQSLPPQEKQSRIAGLMKQRGDLIHLFRTTGRVR